MKILLHVTFFVFLIVGVANGKGSTSIYDELEKKGFIGQSTLFCAVSNGEVTKNVNRFAQNIITAMTEADIVESISSSTSMVIYLLSGSSESSQKMTLHVSEKGEGYIEYMGNIMLFFKSNTIYEVTLSSFNKSSITLSQ